MPHSMLFWRCYDASFNAILEVLGCLIQYYFGGARMPHSMLFWRCQDASFNTILEVLGCLIQ
ncbi:hypothetical protein DPMN_038986 [Dreissena polymorpha]|uniref:Uncharacterized protein n=1 Tax=Dreissena polymorpha TaxID=45954 RepID=A0A9D4MGI4_DREPO|nr:hypothetical protein DPMN_038986 [Dreissena polymorpha]